MRSSTTSSANFLEFSYKAGILLSFIGVLASATYLFAFLWMTPVPAIESKYQLLSQTAERRLLLLSTGVFVAMAFGFLGFALFLIQAKGDLDLDFATQDYKLRIARLSPGLFVILCSTIIIIVCVTFRIEYEVESVSQSDAINQEIPAPPDLPHASLQGMGLPEPVDRVRESENHEID